MRSDKALARLIRLLDEAGVNRKVPTVDDVAKTWDVVRRFAAEPVEDADPPHQDGDMLLAQYGTYDWGDGEYFVVDITRQFSFSVDGEYDHMAQLNCTYRYTPTPQLRALGEANKWAGESIDDFFAGILTWPAYGITDDPVSLDLYYSDV